MNSIKINIEGLVSEGVKLNSAHHPEKIEAIKTTFKEWTSNPQSPIYSGYRKSILNHEGLSQSKHMAQQLRSNFTTMVVAGIGGSALGTRTGLNALSWSISANDRREVLVVDNLDPIEFESILQKIDLEKTCFAIISKSGNTLETVAQMSVFIQRLTSKNLPLQKHLVAVTDPDNGALRRWTSSMDIPTLDLPTAVGGRFSVLTPVGLLPLAFAGVNVDALFEGAIEQFQSLDQGRDQNVTATLGLRLAELERDLYQGHVLMPYSSCLKEFGAWFVQLWGESLGKTESNGKGASPVPVAALGDTDQHSLLQLLVEGNRPLITGFIRIEKWPAIVESRPNMAVLPPDFAALSFATRKTFWEILNAQQVATAKVLKEKDRPVYEILLGELSEGTLGRLFALYMDLTVLTAAAHGVNPYNQPGVERGKQILPEILGQ